MKYSRFTAFACAVFFAGALLASCSDGWKGFYESDLSKYIDVGKYKGVSVMVGKDEVTDADVLQRIDETLAAGRYEEEITQRSAEAGDFVRFDFASMIDGAADTNFMGSDTVIQIGNNAFFSQLGDIESSFIGQTAGDTFRASGIFPEDYVNNSISNSENYSSKSIVFEITLKNIFNLITPELTDEFVCGVSSTSTTVEQYKEEIRSMIAEERKENADHQKMYGAWIAVMDTVEVLEYPKSELDIAMKEIKDNYISLAKSVDSSMTLETYVKDHLNITMDEFNEQIITYAKNTVTEQLLLYYIAQQENLSVTEEEYSAAIADYSAKYDFESPQAFEDFYGTELIKQSMLWDKAMDIIVENAEFVEMSDTEDMVG